MKRGVAFGFAALVVLLAQVAWAFSYYPPGPRGQVWQSRPTISQQFVLGSGEEILHADMWLDGAKVRPVWNAAGLVSYIPPEPLALGTHRVKLSVEISAAKAGYYYDALVSEFTFVVAGSTAAPLPSAGPEELTAMARVNKHRLSAGLKAMTYSDALGASARGHARYLAANPAQSADPHQQRPGTPFFFGVNAGDRAAYFEYYGGTAEVINYVSRAEEAVDGWMETLYHRIPLIRPGMREMGYGLAADRDRLFNVIEAGPGDQTPGMVLWPVPGQQNVPVGWDGGEAPDPFRLYPEAGRPVGYTITLTFGGNVRTLTLTTARLTGPAGGVPVMRFHPGIDSHLEDTVALIPYNLLAPGSTYTVYLAGEVDLGRGPQAYERRWSFTTAVQQPPALRNRVTTSTSTGEVRSISIEGTGFGAGMQVFLGGLPVEGLEVESGEKATFRAPTGYAGGHADLLVVAPDGHEAIWRGFFTGQERFRFPNPGTAFTEVPLLVAGKPLDLPALVHSSGAALLPESALEALGGQRTTVDAIARTYWNLGGRTGDYTLNRAAAAVEGSSLTLAMPVRQRSGSVYVSAEFVRLLAQVGQLLSRERMVVGVPVEGMYDIASHWARDPIARLLRAGIVSGVGDGTFRPDATLTRAAFVKMLAGARGLAVVPGEPAGFLDAAEHWVVRQGYLGAAARAGFVVPGEYPGGRFEPDRPVTREEIAVMVTRSLGRDARAAARLLSLVGGTATLAGKSFTDAWEWTRPGYVAEAVEQGIINGYLEGDGTYAFRPGKQATRAEAAVMTVRTLDK